ncbi:23S rRNA (guanosine(2251)-2'-O)-methyltransferase RlmB [Enterobacteriaceae endosymbiont of Donacia piscatrix]|uniref:23S rRNA (guanosine(2251)-2'-O)-methyltransferase RlmB n=1 Tax=Enterobacteriaceae endosymbiont of Donacia piscatrix TaxID=2675780 RepID=UPI001448DEE5|nr:23S rRNA (guanosine(2251)-2'-O)-methyltransferase RlmB [Enterobacteriaceae endosymbiont of Donacia piscatrix]QJC34857.1 23S rRNA (guanosine(2251)-2'-O)-methyltransferase RlmB [Enterobacteriaceae endosymbiont of Donacia piscatrix]
MKNIIFGIHPIINMLKTNPLSFERIFILNSKKKSNNIKKLVSYTKKHNICIYKVNKKWLDNKTNNSTHQGCLGILNKLIFFKENDIMNIINLSKKILILILDRITDPHNLGACIRSAAAFNVNMIILPKKHSAKINATVKKVSCGTSNNIPIIFVKNLVNTINFLKSLNIFIIGTDISLTNNTLFNYRLKYPICLIMGSENKGIKSIIKNNCDILLSIPMSKNINSLNVSVATSIFLFEINRQNYIS